MGDKRKRYASPFNAKVALAALKNEETTAELVQRFGVHPAKITARKRAFFDGADDVFEKSNKSLKLGAKNR